MKKIFIFVSLSLLGFACTDDFEALNINKNQPVSVTPDLLLPSVIFDLADFSVNQTYGLGDIVAQYAANYEAIDLDIYRWAADGSFWQLYDYLQDIKDIKIYGQENNAPNYEAVALILEAYCFSMLTDAYGDVPFTEANKAENGIISPVYDSQELIYSGIVEKLETANDLIITDEMIQGDILYKGDMLKWKKFGNTLRLRLLMRTSNVQDVSSELSEIVENPTVYPIFESNMDNAIYTYSGTIPDLSPYSRGRSREYGYFLAMPTSHFVNTLKENDDPRLVEWLDLKANEDGTYEYIGVDPGQNLGDIGRAKDFSARDSSYFYETSKIRSIFITFSEVNFILAEAAARNLISENAKSYYDAGVVASFDQWGVEMPADFLSGTAAYDQNDEEQFFEQKWLALYHTGTEAWFDWKRTGMPSFIKAGPGNINNNQVPVRLLYPSLEQSVNGTNYKNASERIGGDNINSRVWWDK